MQISPSVWSGQMPNPQDWYFLPTYLNIPRYMYVLIHLLGQKLNMCSHRFIALGWYRTISLPTTSNSITDFTFLFKFACQTAVLVRTPTDWTNSRTFILVLVLGQVLQAWLASFRSLRESSTRRGRRAPLPETVRTGNLKLQPTIPDHTLHNMTCRPVSVQLYSPPPLPLVTSTAAYLYGFCAGIYEVERLMCSMGEKVNYSAYPTNVDVYRPGRTSRRPTRGNF